MKEGNFEIPQNETISIEGQEFEVDENGFVDFGDVAMDVLKQQTQYASRYVDGKIEGYANLGEDLRFEGDTDDYHFLRIHKDDVAEFIRRHREEKEGKKI